jgi:tetratricopeptide (TPR) repeat protein
MTISSDPIEAQNYTLLTQDLLAGNVAIEGLGHPLPDEMAQQLVHHLKQAANNYWSIDPNKSERLAEMIIYIGQIRRDIWQIALGLMARGDARKFQKKPVAAWDDLQEAGRLFLSLGNQAGEIGWARSRIGPLFICVELNQYDTAFADAKKADAIFTKYGETEFLLNLHINQGIAYAELRQPESALTHYQIAHQLALKLAMQGESYMGRLHLNTGFAHLLAGNLRQAMTVSEAAR